MVEVYLKSDIPIAVPDLPWAYSLDGTYSGLKSKDFLAVTDWQLLGGVYAGGVQNYTIHLSNTATTELDGPVAHTVSLVGYSGSPSNETMWIKVNGVWERAIPYVKHNGVWQVAKPYLKSSGVWVETN